MTFGKSSTFASAFYEKEAQTKRLTVIRDTGNKYNDLKIAATADNSRSSQTASLDLQYNTVLADVGVREEVVKTKGGGTGNRTSVRLLSAFAFVHNGEDYGYSISRPISNSFVIFKPNHDWRDQEFGVQTSNGTSNTSTGLFGESIVSGLTPYQYRMLQLDPSRLEPGHILGQESFVVYPRKNSGHLFVIGKSGLLVLRGRLMDSKKSPLGLKVGFWTSKVTGKSIPFFTDRDGSFLIEGVDVGVGTLQIDESDVSPLVLDLSGKNHGMVEMGDLALEEGESLQ